MRRVVVVTMPLNLPESYSSAISQNFIFRLNFALRYVYTKMIHPYMPISVMTVVRIIMGSRLQSTSYARH